MKNGTAKSFIGAVRTILPFVVGIYTDTRILLFVCGVLIMIAKYT